MDLIVKSLEKWFSHTESNALLEAGLFDTSRFHCTKPLRKSVAEMLVRLPSLRVFQFGDVKPDTGSLRLLNEILFANRKDVTLRVFGLSTWTDISFLKSLPEVERFDWEVDVFGSVVPLGSLKKLMHLGLGLERPKPKIDLQFLHEFSNTLESLSLAGDYKGAHEVIPQLSRLKSAWFVSTKLSDFEFLAGLPIETLGNYGGRVQSFDFVGKLKSLRRLWIKTNAKLERLDFIGELPNLERIELYFLAKITRFPRCEHLKKLNLILAYECNRLSDISELQNLSGVKISVSGKAIKNRLYQTPDFSWSDALNVSGRFL